MLPRRRAALVLALCLLATACGDLPRDPEGTLGRVRGGRLRVGLVERPPWVVRTEVELVRRLAAELNARPEWHWGGEQRQMEALERFELDLVVGGITKSTRWSKYVGLTGPYFEETYAVGFPGSPPAAKSLKGVEVAVRGGDPAAYYLSKEGALVTRVSSLTPVSGPVAAPTWELGGSGSSLRARSCTRRSTCGPCRPARTVGLSGSKSFCRASARR